VDSFERLVADLEAAHIGSTFNFLRDDDHEQDVEGAAEIRRENLLRYLESRADAEVVAVGEAAGYRGARWSGIAFTSERTLDGWGAPYERSSTTLKGWAEPSATIVHRVLGELGAEQRVLLWNVVPTHPHREGAQLSNRRPREAEIHCGRVFSRRLIMLLNSPKVVAIGRVAEAAFDKEFPYVRHPANGGATKFAEALRQHLAR
jgi:uracil-DNA glycosylase